MDHEFKPESLMMSFGYKPDLSEGAVKTPIFQTSTFTFKTAEEGKAYFELINEKRDTLPNKKPGLVYSRLNNPNLEILENRLCLWDQADDCAVFVSGMAAISTALLEFLKPGDLFVYSTPVYGGTDHFIHFILPKFGIETLGFKPGMENDELESLIRQSGKADKLAMIYLETPANPTNDLYNIAACRKVADTFQIPEKEVLLAVDNTFMGPLWQHPLQHGADLVIYSATKYIGGHSDVIAGAVLGNSELMKRVKVLRTYLGNMADPNTAWLLTRSLETLRVRMERQQKSAIRVADFLNDHPNVKMVDYLGLIDQNSVHYKLYKNQYDGPGAMISFEVKGGEAEAFHVLNAFKLIKLAVSLGGTESLVEHPASMTHCGVDPDYACDIGITDSLIRLSVGVEDPDDLIVDLSQALEAI